MGSVTVFRKMMVSDLENLPVQPDKQAFVRSKKMGRNMLIEDEDGKECKKVDTQTTLTLVDGYKSDRNNSQRASQGGTDDQELDPLEADYRRYHVYARFDNGST